MANAQSLQGQWLYCLADLAGTCSGLVVIDAEGRARLSVKGPRQIVTQEGHVRIADGRIEIIFTTVKATSPYALDHFHCVVQSERVLECIDRDVAGQVSSPFAFRVDGTPTPPESNTAVCVRPNA